MKKTNAIRILEQKKVKFDVVEYQYDSENLNVEQITLDNNLHLEQVYKTLVVSGDKTGIVVALVAGNASLNFKKLATASGNKKITMVAVKDLQKHTGYIRGGCSPIGMKKQYAVFISEEAKTLDKIYVNAGVRGLLLGLDPILLVETVDAELAEIV